MASDGATPVAGASVMLTFDGNVVAEAQTDSNGDYTFRVVKPGQYLLSAGTDDGVSAVQIVNVAAGANVSAAPLELGALEVSGTVTAGGVPVSGASVEVLPLAAGAQEQSLTAVTDANGDFVVQGLTPDQYSVAVESAGFAAWQQSLTVAGNLTQSVVLLAGGVVQGTITDASTGLPVAGANVSLLDPATHSVAASAATNASGQYQAANVLPGTYDVLIEEPSHQMTELTGVVVSGSSCTVNGTLAAKSTLLQGTVTDSTGHPMVEATVTVVNSRGETMFVATTAIDGTWSTDELPPGNYTATASAIGYQTASVAVSLAAGSSQAVSLTVAAAATDDAWASNTVAGFLGYVSQLWYSSNNLYLTNPSDPTPKMIGLQNQNAAATGWNCRLAGLERRLPRARQPGQRLRAVGTKRHGIQNDRGELQP